MDVSSAPPLPAGSFWSTGKTDGFRANFLPATIWALLERSIGKLTACSVGAKGLSSGTVQHSHVPAGFLPPQLPPGHQNLWCYLDSPPAPENLKEAALTGLFQPKKAVSERHGCSSPARSELALT